MDRDSRPLNRSDRLLVFAGAALGTGLRYGAFRIWFHRPGTFPTTTLVVNCLGALILGVCVVVLASRANAHGWNAFARLGVLGGFTTFSAYAVELGQYFRDGEALTGVSYAVVMTLLGLASAGVGLGIGARLQSLLLRARPS